MIAELASSWAAAAVVLVVPGPTNTLLATAGAAAPGRAPLVLALAELAGYLVAVGFLALVGDALATAVPAVVPAIRLAVVAYLVGLGVCLWRCDTRQAGAGPITSARIFLATVCNPKAAIFAFVLLPAGDATGRALWFAGFALVVLAAGASWILLGRHLGRIGGPRAAALVPKVAALALFGFAALIARTTLGTLV